MVVLSGLLIAACSSDPGPEDILLGNWRARDGKVHTILTFRKNGSLQWDEKIEGRYNRIVEKKQSVQAQWDLVENRLRITPEETVADTKWQQDQPLDFEILLLNKRHLNLKDHAGKLTKLIRVRSQQSRETNLEEGIFLLDMEPLVVNLRKDEQSLKNRYLCLDLMFLIETGRSLAETEGLDALSLHPRVRELILFYLNAQHYSDVNTFKKIRSVIADLQVVLNPYFNTMLEDIKVKRVIVTSNMEKVEWFMNALKEKSSGDQPGAEDETGKQPS